PLPPLDTKLHSSFATIATVHRTLLPQLLVLLFISLQSNREFFAYLPEYADEMVGPYAIRWRNFKGHYYTAGGSCSTSYHDEACRSNATVTKHFPPLLYNLHTDPQELYPLDPENYRDVIDTISDLKDAFLLDLDWSEFQLLMGKDRSIQPCGNQDCYPFPYCCRTNLLSPRQQQYQSSFSWL
ncbi:Arylsulfatase A, partial [Geodia barretti]